MNATGHRYYLWVNFDALPPSPLDILARKEESYCRQHAHS